MLVEMRGIDAISTLWKWELMHGWAEHFKYHQRPDRLRLKLTYLVQGKEPDTLEEHYRDEARYSGCSIETQPSTEIIRLTFDYQGAWFHCYWCRHDAEPRHDFCDKNLLTKIEFDADIAPDYSGVELSEFKLRAEIIHKCAAMQPKLDPYATSKKIVKIAPTTWKPTQHIDEILPPQYLWHCNSCGFKSEIFEWANAPAWVKGAHFGERRIVSDGLRQSTSSKLVISCQNCYAPNSVWLDKVRRFELPDQYNFN